MLTSPGWPGAAGIFIGKGIDFSPATAKFRRFYGTKPPGPFPNRAYLLAMKFPSKISAGLVSLSLLVAASAEDPVKFNVPGVSNTPAAPTAPAKAPTAAPAAAAPAKPQYTETQVAEAYGWFMGAQMGLRQLEFTKAEVEAMGRGMAIAAAGTQPAFDPKEMGPLLETFLAKKQEGYMTKMRFQNLGEGQAFFTKLKDNKNIVELPSGLRYEILKAGTGAMPKPGQQLSINYTLSSTSGQVLESTTAEGGKPYEFVLQPASQQYPSGVILGMFEGLQKIGVGGKMKLYIPPSLAYGDAGYQGIPPGATLVFEVDVLSAKDAPKEAVAPAVK